jgi:hypothetical protein
LSRPNSGQLHILDGGPYRKIRPSPRSTPAWSRLRICIKRCDMRSWDGKVACLGNRCQNFFDLRARPGAYIQLLPMTSSAFTEVRAPEPPSAPASRILTISARVKVFSQTGHGNRSQARKTAQTTLPCSAPLPPHKQFFNLVILKVLAVFLIYSFVLVLQKAAVGSQMKRLSCRCKPA